MPDISNFNSVPNLHTVRVGSGYFQPEAEDDIKTVFNPLAASQDAVLPPLILEPPLPQQTDAVEESKGAKFSSVKELLKKAWSLFIPDATKDESSLVEANKIDLSMQTIGSRPVLSMPRQDFTNGTQGLMALLKQSDSEQLIKKVNHDAEAIEVEKPKAERSYSNSDEAAVEKATYDIYKDQSKIRDKASVTISQSIIQKGEEKKRLWKQYLDLKEEAQRKARQSKILGWLGIGTGIIGGALFLGSIIAAVVTGGAALPVAFAVVGGIAAISQGSTQIGGAILGHQSAVQTGESFVVKEEMTLVKDEIEKMVQKHGDNDDSITQLWSNLSQMLKNAPTDIFR